MLAIMDLIFEFSAWDFLIVDFAILYIKSSNDILSGVSKLDNILKVSSMQKYKVVLDD